MYSLEQYGAMIADRVRTDAYAEAIARAVKPGDVVVDLGCGPGWMTLAACRAGAKRVYALEIGESIAYARQVVVANGFADRACFVHGPSQKARLPEPANVIVSDLRGTLPLSNDGIAATNALRNRFLAKGGILIPERDVLYAAPVCMPDFYAQMLKPWESEPGGANMSAVLPSVLNTLYATQIKAESLVSDAEPWHTIDYQNGAADSAATGTPTFHAARDATIHGIGLWFETVLFGDIGYSSGPGGATIYGQCFLPLLEPVPVREGQEMQVSLQARLIGGKYLWCWDTVFEDQATGKKRRFSQSTFQSAAFSREVLQRREFGYVPTASEKTQASAWILLAMDGHRTMREIADEAARRFPGVFSSVEEAFDCAVELAERFSA
jgi:type I protein arginine methyltransferase